MFVWAQIPEPFRALGSMEFSKRLIREAKVAVSPGLGFGENGEGYVRFALVENKHRIRQAVRGIRRLPARRGRVSSGGRGGARRRRRTDRPRHDRDRASRSVLRRNAA